MNSSVAVSCVMPLYNAQRFLTEAIQSVLTQSFTDFELIAVDDGSTDRTRAMLEDFARHDRRVRIISRPNTGIVGALNDGIAAAQGEIIARMDGDDVCMPSRFAKQVAYLREHPDCVLVGSRVILTDRDGWAIGDMESVRCSHEEINHELLDAGWPIVHPTVMMRRQAVLDAGGYREGTFPNEDHDLFLRLAELGRLHNLPEQLLRYRRHYQSISSSENRSNVLRRIVDEARRRRGLDAREWKELPVMTRAVERESWAWQALREHHVATARKHALGVMRERPWAKESWRVVYCALRGH